MIGAAGRARFAAGERPASTSTPPVAAAGRPVSRPDAPCAARSTRRRPADAPAAGLRARHALSQNFLADPTSSRRSCRGGPAPGARARDRAGPGLLTGGLLDAGARSRPSSSIAAWRAFLRDRSPELEAAAAPRSRATRSTRTSSDLVEPPYDVVANLPYHITSPILHRLLGETPAPGRLVLMVQREVAERIAAPPGRMSYLSVFVQYHARVRIAFRVPRGVRAGAAVESAVIVVEPYPATTGSTPEPRTRCGASSRPRSASAQDAPQRPVAAAPHRTGPGRRPRSEAAASTRTGGPRPWRSGSGWRSRSDRRDRPRPRGRRRDGARPDRDRHRRRPISGADGRLTPVVRLARPSST
jgi:16S rRNA (adenine1518-N6/adenine1519-N6)-dimethyltransferase